MKKRILTYSITINEDTNIIWNQDEKAFELRNAKGDISTKNLVSIGHSYAREGKPPKFLRQAEYLKGLFHFSPKHVVTDRYIFVDTSYKTYGENLLCATSCHSIEEDIRHDGTYFKGEQFPILQWPRLIFLAKLDTKPERYGWMKCIQALLKSSTHLKNKTYSVVVDSDLNDIPKINSGDLPIFGEMYLPSGFSLQYASADVGKENLQNKMIGQSDRVARISLVRAQEEMHEIEGAILTTDFHDITTFTDPVDIDI